MDEVVLTWNVTNWVTVLLMVIVGFLFLGLIAQVWNKMAARKSNA